LEGTVLGQLTASRASGRITPESWISNEFAFDFLGGYLLYIDPRLSGKDGGVPPHVAGVRRRTDRDRYWDSLIVPSPVNVLAVELPPLRPGQKVDKLGQAGPLGYAQLDTLHAAWAGRPQPDPEDEPMLPTLWRVQTDDWARAFRLTQQLTARLDQATGAGLLASTWGLHVSNPPGNDFTAVDEPLDLTGLMDVDVTHWLAGGQQAGQAILILFSSDPGPAKLHVNGKPVRTPQGRSVYRVRAPIEYTGRPPGTGP
jgi:hypothetical protein